jgi:cation diffusion facilitator CzcD-associated flavoprotein CzcO
MGAASTDNGVTSGTREVKAMTAQTDFDVVVIGAGFSGLYALHKLRDELGLSVRVYEEGGGVGGTWYWNRYPGARCDSESYVYCYSFSKELCEEWNWSGRYPLQEELSAYLEHVADRFELRSDIELETCVTAAHWSDDERCWRIETDRGEIVTAQFLITAVGVLTSKRYVPDISGLESFAGEWHHTSAWPEEEVDFSGKRVAVIGTGSTGVQTIPVIAKQAGHLYVFQRSPQFTIPAHHERVDRAFLDDVKANYDAIWHAAQWSAGGFPWEHNGRSALDPTPEERQELFEGLWAEGGFKFVFGSFKDLVVDRRANDFASEFIRAKIRERVNDPDLAEKLLPIDHPFIARRPIIDTNYFETYNRDNVTLVDVRTFPITRVTPEGIETEDGFYAVDMIVFATGFDAVTGPFLRIDIRGRNGLPLAEHWADGPQTYLGLMNHQFPNMLTIFGPGSTFPNAPIGIEHHVEWIADCIRHMREHGLDVIEPDAHAEAGWMERLNKEADKTLVPLADSWLTGANIPGKKRQVLVFIGHFGRYRKLVDGIAAQGYTGFTFEAGSGASGPSATVDASTGHNVVSIGVIPDK